MDVYAQEFDLTTSLTIDYNLEVERDGILQLVLNLYVGSSDESQVLKTDFYNITERVLSYYTDNTDYTHLFSIANELTQEAERIREVATTMEDSVTAVSDLFGALVDPTA